MTDPRTIVHGRQLAASIALPTDPGETLAWVQICRAGEYKGYSAGPVVWTDKEFGQIVDNLHRHPAFRAGADGIGVEPVVPYDYEHASEAPPTSGSIPQVGAPACGWVYDLQVRMGADNVPQLWALSKFLPQALAQIRSGAYRWTSVAVWTDAVDPVSGAALGAQLTSVALTNQPFVQGMAPIAASAKRAGEIGSPVDRSVTPNGMAETQAPVAPAAPVKHPIFRRLAKRLVALRRIRHEDASEEQIAEETEEAMDALEQISKLLDNPEVDKLQEKLAKLVADGAKAAELAPALEQARAALKASAEKDADEEAQMAAEEAAEDEKVQQKLLPTIKLARHSCIDPVTGLVVPDKLKAFRATWLSDAKLAERRRTLLTSKIFAGSNGEQLTGGKELPHTDVGAPKTADGKSVAEAIAPFPGCNNEAKARNYLLSLKNGFEHQPEPMQFWLASQFVRTGKLVLG